MEADHPSGIYFAKGPARLTLLVENPTSEPFDLSGSIAFGPEESGTEIFKPLSVTPIASSTLAAGQQAKITLAINFAAVGTYKLYWRHDNLTTPIENAGGASLQAIFAPRATGGGGAVENPWLTILPQPAPFVPAYMQDFCAQTSIRRFLMDDRFVFDPATNIALAVGASTGATTDQLATMFGDLAGANASVVLRVAVPVRNATDAKTIKAFHAYIAEAVKNSRRTITAIAVIPAENEPTYTDAERDAYRSFYIAAYQAAKTQNRGIVMLGAGSATLTRDLLLASSSTSPTLQPYIDAVAIENAAGDPALAHQLLPALSQWVLPPTGPNPWSDIAMIPPAGALAQGATVVSVPPPSVDNGVTAHLFSGAVFYQVIHPESLPYIAVFQADGYSIAAIGGVGTHSAIDAVFPHLAATRTTVTADDGGKPAGPNVELPDDTESMRVVDSTGNAVNCRDGDTLYVPADTHVVYLLQAVAAEDLASVLRPARLNHVPLFDVATDGRGKLVGVALTNIASEDMGGTVRIIAAGTGGTLLGEKRFVPLGPGKALEVAIELKEEHPGPFIVEIEAATGNGKIVGTQRTYEPSLTK